MEITWSKDAESIFHFNLSEAKKVPWFNFFFYCINVYKKRMLWATKNSSSRSLVPDGLILLLV